MTHEQRLLEALKEHHAKVVHTMQIPNNCPTCALIASYEQGTGEVLYTEAQMREAWRSGHMYGTFDTEWDMELFKDFIATQRSKVNE